MINGTTERWLSLFCKMPLEFSELPLPVATFAKSSNGRKLSLVWMALNDRPSPMRKELVLQIIREADFNFDVLNWLDTYTYLVGIQPVVVSKEL